MKIKNEKNRLKLISLLIALILFISANQNFKNFSILGNNHENSSTSWVRDIPLEVEYDREKLYVIGLPSTVSVKLTGSNSKVQKESIAKNFKVKLNLKDAKLGEDQKVKPEIEGLGSGLEGSVEPQTLTVSIREKVTKEFPVTPVVRKERLLLGFEVERATVSDTMVKISGAAESIESIYEVRAESDARTKINKPVKEEAKLVAYDKDFNKIEDIDIEPRTTVMSLELKTVEKEVNIVVNQIGAVPAGFELINIVPKIEKAIIRGESEEALANVSELYVDVELSGIQEEKTELTNLKVYAKDGTPKIAVDTPTVDVTVNVKKK